MLSQARDLDYCQTGSALEAALLESDEIKRHLPPYNKALRPDRRSLVCLSRDLKSHSPVNDHRHCIGPLPHDRLIDALQAFAAWLERGLHLPIDDPAFTGPLLLALPQVYAPDIDSLLEGLDRFRANHISFLQHRSAFRAATALGAQVRSQQLEDAAGAQVEEESREDDEAIAESGTDVDADQFAWTPEAVARAMENMLARTAHLIRRARWYALLSESCLTWTPAGKHDGSKYLLVIECGAVARSDILPARRKAPAPPCLGRSWHDRRKALDLATCDRLRVLTTELVSIQK
jgi:DNA polymerase-3 subunit epsilon